MEERGIHKGFDFGIRQKFAIFVSTLKLAHCDLVDISRMR